MSDIQERILEYINSRDIRDYLRKQRYKFNMKEAAWLVYQDKNHYLDEKLVMWEEIAGNMDDVEFCGGASDDLGSCRSIILKFVSCIKRYRELLEAEGIGALYQYEVLNWQQTYHDVFTDINSCISAMESHHDMGGFDFEYTITWQSPQYPDLIIRCTYDSLHILKDIYVDCHKWNEEDYGILCETFAYLWFKFPVPFSKGDIVIDCTRENIHDGCATGVFALDNVYTEKYAEDRLKFGDNSDMTAWGYFLDEGCAVYSECMHAYMNLEYFRGELSGNEKLLIAVSNYLKGKIDFELLLLSQRYLMLKDKQNDLKLCRYTKEGLELAGIKSESSENDEFETPYGTAEAIQDTLRYFDVSSEVRYISSGLTVDKFEVTLNSGATTKQLMNLMDDIKLMLHVPDIRIEEPDAEDIPIVMEIPNKKRLYVGFSSLSGFAELREAKSPTAFVVGRDAAYNTVVSDLDKTQNLLIAGQSGSGKTVFINSIIMSILYRKDPDEVRFVLIDPKTPEFQAYKDMPHLLYPIETDPQKAIDILDILTNEMMERFKKFAKDCIRSIWHYNEMHPEYRMPQIIVIIDELAELMRFTPERTENAICRLAKLGSAAGMHLVIATQCPREDVLTESIRACITSRAVFEVSCSTDSRMVLGMDGAEKLLGQGDMLYITEEMSKPLRIQGALVPDKVIEKYVRFLKSR